MDPISLITLASNIVPALIRFAGKGEKTAQIAESIGTVAKQIAGVEDPAQALETIAADPAKILDFRAQMEANELTYVKIYLEDLQDARKRDTEIRRTGQYNYRADLMVLGAAIIVCFLVTIIWKDNNISEFTKGAFMLVLGRFLGYLDGIFNFEFGTTRETKDKAKMDLHLKGLAARKE